MSAAREGSIRTDRLDLVPLSLDFLRAAQQGDDARTQAALGHRLGAWGGIDEHVLALRCQQLEEDPGLQEWLLRGMILRGEDLLIGHVGFHSRPDPDYLAAWCPGGVELGFTVYEPYRGRGFAAEAARGLMGWAAHRHGVRRFVATVAPGNAASQRLVGRLGFARVGTHMDEVDGPEDVLVLDWPGP